MRVKIGITFNNYKKYSTNTNYKIGNGYLFSSKSDFSFIIKLPLIMFQ